MNSEFTRAASAHLPNLNPHLILFDCDGVLVDSEGIAAQTLSRFLTHLGWPLTPQDITTQFKGQSLHDTRATVEAKLGAALPSTWLYDLAMHTALDFAKDLKPILGVTRLLSILRGIKKPFCVASQSTPERIELSLRLTGLASHFEPISQRCFSAMQVPRGKPHPDLFLHAAKSMGFAPADCLVIEDSPTGVTAGLRAGMQVLGYAGPGGGKAEALQAAGAEVCDSMEAIAARLGIQIGPEPDQE